MNVALSAVFVFLVVFPGFLFRSRLKRTERASLDYSPFGRTVMEAVLWAMLLHGLWLLLARGLLGERLAADVVLGLLSSAPAQQQDAIARAAARWPTVAGYFASLSLFSLAVPTLIRRTISSRGWDRFDSRLAALCRFDEAPWYYLLTGADFERSERPDSVNIAAVVDVAGNPVLYTGLLDDFFFDTEGQLDRLVLENVSRRPLSEDKSSIPDSQRFYGVDGDYFVLKYSDVLSLNVRYVHLEPADGGPTDASG